MIMALLRDISLCSRIVLSLQKKERKRNYPIWRNIPLEVRVRADFSPAFPEVREIFGVRQIFVIYSNGQNSGASRGAIFYLKLQAVLRIHRNCPVKWTCDCTEKTIAIIKDTLILCFPEKRSFVVYISVASFCMI